jgi:hypothetical protein
VARYKPAHCFYCGKLVHWRTGWEILKVGDIDTFPLIRECCKDCQNPGEYWPTERNRRAWEARRKRQEAKLAAWQRTRAERERARALWRASRR